MKTFFNVEDLGDLKAALAEAQDNCRYNGF